MPSRFRREQRLTDEEICERYRLGENRGMIGLRARRTDREVCDILARNGIALRTWEEVKRLSEMARKETRARAAARIKARREVSDQACLADA